ncbi:MAG: hypothetical protein JO286_02740 [Solirubrobacterales bacterium]|nr:hypothetical protein [Solirubrobacterales bacterium]MBV9806069.1 hypothetical protein [Solirubrobacterales bacterium]
MVLDVTTSSTGRRLVRATFESILDRVRSHRPQLIAGHDPSSDASAEERRETTACVPGPRSVDSRIAGATIEAWPANVGLDRSMLLVLSHRHPPLGVHREVDGRFLADLHLHDLVLDLADQRSTRIAVKNTHVARDGTFDRTSETLAVAVHDGRIAGKRSARLVAGARRVPAPVGVPA